MEQDLNTVGGRKMEGKCFVYEMEMKCAEANIHELRILKMIIENEEARQKQYDYIYQGA